MIRNQKGYTLIELVVVIAIMSVVISVGVTSYGLVVGQNIKGCTADVQGYIAQTRVQALSRADASLTLYTSNKGVFVNLSTEGRDVKIGRPSIEIKYTTVNRTTNATTEVELSETEKLVLRFDRSTGAFQPINGTTDTYCTSIILTSGGRIRTIKLIPQTGKYYLEG